MSEKKFNPKKAVQEAAKKQPGANYAIELPLSPQDAEPFEYLSDWQGNGLKYRVVARLNLKDGNINVQLRRVP